ncbi:MAG TPA: hypothetical protein VKT73_14010 [Xanthobacteraceae bacterium]|nr:hypothetical protein [Xanthobacteraceae bacterium]
MPMVIAVGLGPLIAGLIFCLLAVYTNFSDPSTVLPISDLFKMFSIYIVFAYFAGGPIALLAGLIVSIWMIWRSPGLVVAIAAAIIAVCLFRLAAEIEFLSSMDSSMVYNNFVLLLVLSGVAAGVCWLLTRRFARTK